MTDHYLRRAYRLPAELEEEWVAALWSAGTLGVQELASDAPGEVRLEAWFEPPGPQLDEAAWRERGLRPEEAAEIEAYDWFEPWRRWAQPIEVGKRFLLDPREPEEGAEGAQAEGRITLRLPARNAFGTGSHESTRLALTLLESTPVAGRHLVDVGTGSGVLAFAALALGAASVLGYDIDPASPVQAKLNVGLNQPTLSIGRLTLYAGTADALRPGPHFDLALVNVLPERIREALPQIVAGLKSDGEMLFSGMLIDQPAALSRDCAAHGLREIQRVEEADWAALRLTRTAIP